MYRRPEQVGSYSCRCFPQLICFTFTPVDGSDECCRAITIPVLPTLSTGIIYLLSFGLTDYELKIESGYWKVLVDDVEVGSAAIDHTNTTCLSPPDFEVTGIMFGDCEMVLTFSTSDMVTLPFIFRDPQPFTEDYLVDVPFLPYGGSPCDCTHVTGSLCVSGVRHAGGDEEFVEFVWDESLKDRWSYMPEGGNPTTDQEHIYIRGNGTDCYLELDFEQSGTDTNDWADPPNTFDINEPYEVREGMIPLPECSCGIRITGLTSTGGRSIRIHAGPCDQYRYYCGGRCRCVPRYLCVIGSVDYPGLGDNFSGTGEWDGSGWDVDGIFRLTLTSDGAGGCALRAEGLDLEDSDAISCGPFLSAELYEDPATGTDWMWVSSPVCGNCLPTTCGDCSDERCGGPPLTLFVDLQARCLACDPPTTCDLTVVVQYYQRWDTTTIATPICGYIGYSDPITCDYDTFRIRVDLFNFGVNIDVRREYLSGPIFDAFGPTGDEDEGWFDGAYDLTAILKTCDPYYKEGDWVGVGEPRCMWGCGNPMDQYRVIVYE